MSAKRRVGRVRLFRRTAESYWCYGVTFDFPEALTDRFVFWARLQDFY
ncbi:hypothetical protein [Luteimonas sp. YGD11-2]|nr:hypothetical protein [Luteimonas sp. YGD11-2]